ncbi:MAG: peptidoglycan DD-metalloendopeptidase family protein [Nitriliruptoraceae bacterium]
MRARGVGKWRLWSLALAMAALMGAGMAWPAHAIALDSLDQGEADHQLEQARRGINEVRTALSDAQEQVATAESALTEADALLAQMEAIVNDIHRAVGRQQRQVATAEIRLGKIRADHDAASAALARQAVEIYKRGAGHRIEILLRADGANAAAARTAYLRVATDVGRVTLEMLEAAALALTAEQQRFDGEQQRLDRLMAGQQQVVDEIADLRSHRALAAAEARAQAAELEQRLDDLEADEAALLDLIRTRQQEARQRTDVRRQALARGAGVDEIADEVARIRPVSDADYAWPMCVPVTSEYGPRWGRMHRGLDQPARPGERIHAVKDGRVLFADWYGGFGRLVLVDHGDGVVSAYAHLSRFGVLEGDGVVRGQTVGTVGSTGFSTGPHLHLEFRVSGEAIDPRRLLPSRKC